MADATAALLMPPLMRQLDAVKALATVRVSPLTTRDPAPLLERDDADLAIGHFHETLANLGGPSGDSPLRLAPIDDTDYVCAMRTDHSLAARGPC